MKNLITTCLFLFLSTLSFGQNGVANVKKGAFHSSIYTQGPACKFFYETGKAYKEAGRDIVCKVTTDTLWVLFAEGNYSPANKNWVMFLPGTKVIKIDGVWYVAECGNRIAEWRVLHPQQTIVKVANRVAPTAPAPVGNVAPTRPTQQVETNQTVEIRYVYVYDQRPITQVQDQRSPWVDRGAGAVVGGLAGYFIGSRASGGQYQQRYSSPRRGYTQRRTGPMRNGHIGGTVGSTNGHIGGTSRRR